MFQIMVVEDDTNTRRLMETVLKQHGYQPILACDGVEALEKMESRHVDLIVLDLMMPRMDGYEFTRTLRDSGSDIPILMVTAKETPQDKKKGFIIGTDDYMVKPVDEEEMLLRIAALLRRSRIVADRRLNIGGTELNQFHVRHGGRQNRVAAQEGISASVQAPVLSGPHLHPPPADG